MLTTFTLVFFLIFNPLPLWSSEDEHEEHHESYEHEEHHDDDEHHGHRKSQQNRDEFKIYGTIEQIADNGVGIWIIDGRKINVTAETKIKEQHGKAAIGAYVKVEGYYQDKTYNAYEVEIKKAKQ
jgi:hypothetical protein